MIYWPVFLLIPLSLFAAYCSAIHFEWVDKPKWLKGREE